MLIRPVEEADAAAVAALWGEVVPNEPPRNDPAAIFRRRLARQRELFFVAEIDGEVVGTVLTGYDGHRGWLYRVAVRPSCRRRGVGTQLVRHAEAALAALGCPKINLQVRGTNAAVVAFYESLGYEVEPHISMGKALEVPGAGRPPEAHSR